MSVQVSTASAIARFLVGAPVRRALVSLFAAAASVVAQGDGGKQDKQGDGVIRGPDSLLVRVGGSTSGSLNRQVLHMRAIAADKSVASADVDQNDVITVRGIKVGRTIVTVTGEKVRLTAGQAAL